MEQKKETDKRLSFPLKAKVVADYFNEEKTLQRLRKILMAFCDEASEMIRSRKVKRTSALISVLREQDLKWKAFARMCDEVNPSAYQVITHYMLPEMVTLWPIKK